jgi:cysteine synthase A
MNGTFLHSKPVDSVLELIGNTPAVRINKLAGGGMAEIFAKVEFFNPCSSVKDRICSAMIEAAEASGALRPGIAIVEPTSGNTGIGLAFVCAIKGYRLILTMPETMTVERRNMLRAFGAEVILTEGKKGMRGAVEKAAELSAEHGYFQPQQFRNPANPQAHRDGTALEVMAQFPVLDAFVAGVGTGGTITGVGSVLKKERGSDVKIVAVEPLKSAVLSGSPPGPHGIQGIGAGFIPDVLDRGVIDEIIRVSDEDAFEWTRRLIRDEGILCGISSGANFCAAREVAMRLGPGRKILTVFPDTAERYLSTGVFGERP